MKIFHVGFTIEVNDDAVDIIDLIPKILERSFEGTAIQLTDNMIFEGN